jgi:nucleoside-diphosphate-sugar epimerase
MRTLVTEGTGLLGNNLVRALIDAGHEVWALLGQRKGATRAW